MGCGDCSCRGVCIQRSLVVCLLFHVATGLLFQRMHGSACVCVCVCVCVGGGVLLSLAFEDLNILHSARSHSASHTESRDQRQEAVSAQLGLGLHARARLLICCWSVSECLSF